MFTYDTKYALQIFENIFLKSHVLIFKPATDSFPGWPKINFGLKIFLRLPTLKFN
jgi:hypothetical protein